MSWWCVIERGYFLERRVAWSRIKVEREQIILKSRMPAKTMIMAWTSGTTLKGILAFWVYNKYF